jgi:flagellar biosynthesis repressor protein FlbT
VKSPLKLGLRANELIYINGAVLRVDRKVRVELLNDVTFLLEAHVMQPEQATTPLRQLYFLVQSLIMDPGLKTTLGPSLESAIAGICAASKTADTVFELSRISDLILAGSAFDALKALRPLIASDEQPEPATSKRFSALAEATP